MTRLLAFAGSSRRASYNRRAVDQLVTMAGNAGAEVATVDLGALDIPLYNADAEAALGLPEGATLFRSMLSECDAMIVGCPEYNGFITPLLLNAIDWATRSGQGGLDVSPFAGKPVAIASASPGMFGGVRSTGHLRTLLSGIGCLVMPLSLVVPSAAGAFNEDGTFSDERIDNRAEQVVARLLELTGKLT